MAVTVARGDDPATSRRLLETLTARLPQWFAQAEANRHYAEQAQLLEHWVARIDRDPIGLLLLKRHGPVSAEIYWLGVDPDHHRRGVGRALIAGVERSLGGEKVKYLLVMTLHPEVDHEPYRRTRSFYEALGFDLAVSSKQGATGPSSDPLAYYLKAL